MDRCRELSEVPEPSQSSTTYHWSTCEGICRHCLKYSRDLKRCSQCKEVAYCDGTHQKLDWKKHKASCKAVAADPVSVWVEVGTGEGSGLGNKFTNHIFANREDGLAYMKKQFQNNPTPPLRSPFAELLGWNIEIYCSNVANCVTLEDEGTLLGQGRMNAAGVFLGCDIQSGLSRYTNLSGNILVTGRRKTDGKPLNKDVLWGIVSFVFDAMDLYGESHSPHPMIMKWATMYHRGNYSAGGKTPNVYEDDFSWKAVDHRS